jgi:hypothetical protein
VCIMLLIIQFLSSSFKLQAVELDKCGYKSSVLILTLNNKLPHSKFFILSVPNKVLKYPTKYLCCYIFTHSCRFLHICQDIIKYISNLFWPWYISYTSPKKYSQRFRYIYGLLRIHNLLDVNLISVFFVWYYE